MPTFVAMSSRNKWVAISTNGLLSGNRESEAISAVPLEARPAEDEGVPGPEDRGDVAALSHRVQVADHIAVDVRDRHVRERSHLALDAERCARFSDRHVERRPPEVRLLPHAAREVVPDPLPELDDPVGARLLDHVLDQGCEGHVDHEEPPAMGITRTNSGLA